MQVRRVKLLDDTTAIDAIRMLMAEAGRARLAVAFWAKVPDRPGMVDEDQREQVEARSVTPPRDAGRSCHAVAVSCGRGDPFYDARRREPDQSSGPRASAAC